LGATCATSPAPTDFECVAPFPALSSGRRVLEISAADPLTGLESERSGPLTVEVDNDGRPRVSLTEDPASGPLYVAAPVPPPSTACTVGTPIECFAVSVVASDIAPVRRLLPLFDGRLLVLQQNGAVTMLPSGTSERPEFAARPGTSAVDVAAHPDFHVNRFLYFAITARAPDGRRSASVVRVRELADRLGEPATLIADLPAAPAGDPAISIGPDRRIYLAMPGAADDGSGYGGYLLRFTPDGRAAGDARTGSPILARGRSQPTRLAWDAASRLLILSGEPNPVPALSMVQAEAGSVGWPAAPIAVGGTLTSLPNARLRDVAAAPGVGTPADLGTLAMTGGEPGVLLLATVTAAAPPEVASVRAVRLGSLTPAAVGYASNGDLIVAASRDSDSSAALLLRLRRITAQRLP
jgi:hypothetical protein